MTSHVPDQDKLFSKRTMRVTADFVIVKPKANGILSSTANVEFDSQSTLFLKICEINSYVRKTKQLVTDGE